VGDTAHRVAVGLLVIGVILVVGGIVLASLGVEGPEWLPKTIAIVIGALITLAGGTVLRREPHD